jgi:hypothetical protein
VRQRERLLEYAASHIQHMQKALTAMNVQLHHVVADITGATGLRIIRAILAGERDPNVLAGLRHYSCYSSAETIAKALTGSYRPEHLFALEQALDLYDAYHEKASACDVRIEAVLKELSIHHGRDHGAVPPPRRRHRTDQANALAFDVRAALFALLGKDITAIDGLGAYLSLKLIAECGDDLSSWPTAKHLPPGWGWRRATRSLVARCCRHERAGPAAGLRHFCALLPSPSDAPTPRSAPSTDGSRLASERPRR